MSNRLNSNSNSVHCLNFCHAEKKKKIEIDFQTCKSNNKKDIHRICKEISLVQKKKKKLNKIV
jgi:hypothetical protein